jgi:hypothetical protein
MPYKCIHTRTPTCGFNLQTIAHAMTSTSPLDAKIIFYEIQNKKNVFQQSSTYVFASIIDWSVSGVVTNNVSTALKA